MGKFSDYVGSIKEQTDLLRTNLTQATGQDCSGKSIAQCAGVVSDYISESEVGEDIYVSPSWYPNIEEIVTNAPNITVGTTTYYPLYIMLFPNNYEYTTPFYRNMSNTATALNYKFATGGDAVLCSDDCNKDIANASAETLQVGATIEHTWDVTKDYTDPTGNSNYGVRWAIVYSNSITSYRSVYLAGYCSAIEIVARQGTYNNFFLNDGSSAEGGIAVDNLLSFKMLDDFKLSSDKIQQNNFCSGRRRLKTLIVSNSIVHIMGQYIFSYLTSLTKLILPRYFDFGGTNSYLSCFYGLNSLKTLDLSGCVGTSFAGVTSSLYVYANADTIILNPNLTTLNIPIYSGRVKNIILPPNLEVLDMKAVPATFAGLYNLRYIKIPSSVTTWLTTSSSLGYTTYIELFNEFNISGVNLTGVYVKEVKWFKDLCVWLKDRTGDTANTMILGTANLSIMNSIYLTYNPNDINDITFDGVTSSTEGAMSIVDYISNVKNWTLS